jgi:hypothetical protein
MKQIALLLLVILFTMDTARSQTNTEKYFKTDPISFVWETCTKTIVKKKKEEINCHTDNYLVRMKDSTIIELKHWSDDPTGAPTTSGNLLEVDFISSKIQKKTVNGKDAIPADSYLLKLEGKYGTSPFTRLSQIFKPTTSSWIYLPFATYEDAAAAKKYLESLVGIDWQKVK